MSLRLIQSRLSAAAPCLALLLASLLATAASAQPLSATEPGRQGDTGPSRAVPALAISAAATAGGLGLAYAVSRVEALQAGVNDPGPVAVATAVALGPAAGNLWLGAPRDAAVGVALRALGAGAVLYGIAHTDDGYCDDCYVGGEWLDAGYRPSPWPGRAVVGGLVLVAGGVAYDVVTQVGTGARGGVRVAPAGAGLALSVAL